MRPDRRRPPTTIAVDRERLEQIERRLARIEAALGLVGEPASAARVDAPRPPERELEVNDTDRAAARAAARRLGLVVREPKGGSL